MKPIISVIVPVYNSEKYLSRCIESIISQSFVDLEIILINDGSFDKSGDICEKYKDLDNRIIVIHKENGGVSSARNIGLSIARGEYIGFVDSDDYIEKNMYFYLYNHLINSRSDISMCDYYVDFYKSNNINKEEVRNSFEIINNIEAIKRIYDDKGWKYEICWNKLFKRELFEKIFFPEGKIHEDALTTYKLLYKAKSICITTDKLYHYYQSEESITRKEFNIKRLDLIDAMNEKIQLLKDENLTELQYSAEEILIKTLIEFYYETFNLKKEKKYLLDKIKKMYNKSFNRNILNKNISIKEKIAYFIFWVNPNIYLMYFKK